MLKMALPIRVLRKGNLLSTNFTSNSAASIASPKILNEKESYIIKTGEKMRKNFNDVMAEMTTKMRDTAERMTTRELE